MQKTGVCRYCYFLYFYMIVYSMLSAEWKMTCPVVLLIVFGFQANPSQEEQLDALGTLPGLGQAGSLVRMKHKVHVHKYLHCKKDLRFLRYHSVCPLVGIGTPPTPSPPSECVSPSETHSPKGGREWGSPTSEDWRKSLVLRGGE
jgi:hypothetical protein